MPWLLSTYLATEILGPFFASLLILNAILFLGRLIPLLDVIFDFGIGPADFIRLCAYITPKLLLFSLPMASMAAVIIAFTRMANDNEVIALKASGIGLYRMLPPVVAVAAATALITGITSTSLIPAGSRASKQLLLELAKEKIDKGMRPRQFSEGLGDLVLYVDRIDPDSGEWQGVYLSDIRDRHTPITILARTGSLAARLEEMEITLTLADGTLHRAVDDLTQTIRFDSYTLKVPLENPQTVLGESAASAGKSSMTQDQLLHRAEKLGPDSPEGANLLVEYHKRLALPASCFILTLLGLPLALFTPHGRRPVGLPLGLALFVIYYVLLTAASGISENTGLPVAPAVWLPNVLFGLLTIVLIRRVAREQPSRLAERLDSMVDGLAALTARITGREKDES